MLYELLFFIGNLEPFNHITNIASYETAVKVGKMNCCGDRFLLYSYDDGKLVKVERYNKIGIGINAKYAIDDITKSFI